MHLTRISLTGVALVVTMGFGLRVSAQDSPPDVDAIFQRLDKNGDGKLSASEIPEDQSRYFERLLRRANKEAGSELTREEFRLASKPDERPNVPLGADNPDQNRFDARQRFEMLDRNKDGKVTLEEVPETLRDRLKPLFDRTGKQELTIEDFSRFAGPGGGGFDPAVMFKRFDANSDGKLTRDELPPEVRDRFAPLFDRTGKTELTLGDITAARGLMAGAVERGQGLPGAFAEGMFSRLDANSDGKLTAAEVPDRARPMIENVLRRAGKDADGAVTKDEFLKYFPQFGARDGGDQNSRGERRPEGTNDERAMKDRAERGAGERGAPPDRPAGGRTEGNRAAGERSGDRNNAERKADGEDRGRNPGRGGDGPVESRGIMPFRTLDTNHDGRLSKDEFAKIVDLFDQLDRNHDGQLEPQELFGMPIGLPGRRGDAMPANGDRGESGRRDPDRTESGRTESGRDGDASRRDRQEGRDGERVPGAVFQRLDRDGDGRISKDEAPPFLKDKFAMLDTNGDGFVSQDELKAGAQLLGEGARNRQPEGSH